MLIEKKKIKKKIKTGQFQVKLALLNERFFSYLFRNVELSRIGPMCHEPMASRSALARSVLQLLETQNNVDLDFILPGDSGSGQAQILKAHRVILAARCHWFHRALLSGMREAIDRYFALTLFDLYFLFI